MNGLIIIDVFRFPAQNVAGRYCLNDLSVSGGENRISINWSSLAQTKVN